MCRWSGCDQAGGVALPAVVAARGVLLGLGTDVEVVAPPPELRAEMVETALAVARLYGLRKRASRKQ